VKHRHLIPAIVLSLAVVWSLAAAQSPSHKVLDDPVFSSAYEDQRSVLAGIDLDVLIEELRSVIETVAARGSQVQSASASPRVRGFERMLLQGMKDLRCRSGTSASLAASQVADRVEAAGTATGLKLDAFDSGRLTALAVRVIEKTPSPRLCRSVRLEDLTP
jgi:hypothetical protein